MTRMLSFVIVSAVAACSWSTVAAAGQTPPAPAAAEAPARPVPAELPAVVARVNGEAISKGDLEGAIAQLESRVGRPMPTDQRDRVIRGVLDQLIGYRLLQQESVTRSIAVPDADIDARVAELRKDFPTDQAFQEALQQQNMTAAQLRDDVRKGLQVNGLIDAELAAKSAVTPEQVNQFYASNSFQQGERVHASHILVLVQEGADAPAKEQARAKAAGILTDVKAGKDFAELARQNSQDPGSAPNGGDLGFFERGQMVGPFEEAAFSLMPGATSELVETRFGFHIIRVIEKQTARTIPIEEVRERIESYLKDQNREQQTQAFVDALRVKAKVEILI
ncbi:MAG: peptidylprolyl isomerase [Acidobacteria bacterium]|nr:peptidylprolyl isomerase [Acidobacteriota bacterium]